MSPEGRPRRIFDDLAGDPDVEPFPAAPEFMEPDGRHDGEADGAVYIEQAGDEQPEPEYADAEAGTDGAEPLAGEDAESATDSFEIAEAAGPPPPEAPPRVVDELDEAYAEVRRRIATMGDEAAAEAERIRHGGEQDAEEAVRAAQEEAQAIIVEAQRLAADQGEEARRHAAQIREEADAYSRDMRLAVDAYGTKHRREAEQEARDILQEAEQRARATQVAAEEAARELERIALRREEELQAESRILEERRQRVLAGLREIASQLEEVPPSVAEADFDLEPEARRPRAARRR